MWRWLGLPIRAMVVLMVTPFALAVCLAVRCFAPYEPVGIISVEETLDFIWYGIW